jgi:hypothetical protein
LIKEHRKDLLSTINGSLSDKVIEGLARETKFTKRSGKIPASCFVNTLMSSENEQAHTSLPDLASGLREAYNIGVSKEAMHQKFTPEAVSFLEKMLENMLGQQLKTNTGNGVGVHFPCIKVKDSTKFSLPCTYGGEYKGYGNFSKKNGLMSLQYEYDLVSGNWLSARLTKGLRNDQRDSMETVGDITEGGLHIRDLGYITPTYMLAVTAKKAFFLNRLPAMAGVYTVDGRPLDWKKVDRQMKGNGCMELGVLVYEKAKVPCRLVVEHVGGPEYARRLRDAEAFARSKGLGISELHRIKLRYNLLITNVEAGILPVASIRKAYYLRWQVELVFKTWKSFFRINLVKKVKKERLECQLLARLLWVLVNWTLFNRLNRHVRKSDKSKGVSMLVFFKRSLKFAATLRLVLLKKFSITAWLKHIYIPLIEDCLCEAPKKKQTHYESLNFNNKPLA